MIQLKVLKTMDTFESQKGYHEITHEKHVTATCNHDNCQVSDNVSPCGPEVRLAEPRTEEELQSGHTKCLRSVDASGLAAGGDPRDRRALRVVAWVTLQFAAVIRSSSKLEKCNENGCQSDLYTCVYIEVKSRYMYVYIGMLAGDLDRHLGL